MGPHSLARPYTPRVRRRSLPSLLVLLAVALLLSACVQTPAASRSDVKILLGEPTTLDPAAAGDAGSAAFIAQLYETVTAFDDDRRLVSRCGQEGRDRETNGGHSQLWSAVIYRRFG